MTFSGVGDYTDQRREELPLQETIERIMSHSVEHGPVSHATEERPYFPAAEWEQFQKDDIAAGKAIILLMSSIFTIGLFIYIIVAIAAGTS